MKLPTSFVRRNAQTIIVAFVTAAVTASAPAVAGVVASYAKNAGKVDGVHAVRSKASLDAASKKLVAHNKRGVIPAKFVPKAGNAATLDGLDASDFAQADHSHDTVGGLTPDEIGATEISILLVPGRLPNEDNAMQNCGSDDYRPLPNTGCPVSSDDAIRSAWTALVDPANYPDSANVMFEAAMEIVPSRTACARLYDFTDDQPVAGSEICVANPSATEKISVRIRSSSFTLDAGLHEYGVEVKPEAGNLSPGSFLAGSVVLDW